MLIVAVLPSILSPPKKAVRQTGGRAVRDTTRMPAVAESAAAPTLPSAPSARPPVRASVGVPAETVWVTSSRYRLGLSTAGARLVLAELPEYRSFAAGDSGRPVQLVPPGRPLLAHSILLGADTISYAVFCLKKKNYAVDVGTVWQTLYHPVKLRRVVGAPLMLGGFMVCVAVV